MRALLVALTVVAALGCQSKKDAISIICEAPAKTNIDRVHPSEKQMRMSRYIEAELDNSEVRELFQAMASMTPEQRAAALRQAVAEVGLENCLLLDYLDRSE